MVVRAASQTQRLGRWVAEVSWNEAPPDVAEAIRSSLLFNLSLANAGIHAEGPAQQSLAAVLHMPGGVPVWRTGGGACVCVAAALNAAALAARGQNDTHPLMNGHPGCIVWPAVLALARERRLPAREVMSAALAGYEVAARAPGGQGVAVAGRGWRCTSVYGVLAAAAACARLLGLDAGRSAHALGIACQFASGTMQCYAEGTTEWLLHVANAARTGVEAALLAQQGLAACTRAMEGEQGLYRGLTGLAPPEPLDRWTAADLALKAFPGCAINQSAVQLLCAMLARHAFPGQSVIAVALWLHPDQARHPGVAAHGPFVSAAGAFMSAPFMLQAVLDRGTLQWRDFEDEDYASTTHERSRRIVVHSDDAVPRFGCRLELSLADGSRLCGEGAASAGVPARWSIARGISRDLLAEGAAAGGRGARVSAESLAAAVNAFSHDAGCDVAGLLACAGLE
jgi:2-methylcitrate dehydratase PrpD